MACGVEVAHALKAAEELAREGIDAEVVDVMSVKPLDEETIVASASKCGRVLTVEEHSVYGGMGSAVAELLGERCPVPVTRMGMTGFGPVGNRPPSSSRTTGSTRRLSRGACARSSPSNRAAENHCAPAQPPCCAGACIPWRGVSLCRLCAGPPTLGKIQSDCSLNVRFEGALVANHFRKPEDGQDEFVTPSAEPVAASHFALSPDAAPAPAAPADAGRVAV